MVRNTYSRLIMSKLVFNDHYTQQILIDRYNTYKQSYLSVVNYKQLGIPIRQQNPPEDITENITKFIIRNYENDECCIWCKGIDKKYKLNGDLYSENYDKTMPIEVKSFTSNGPSQFGPNKKFGVLYFLDMREWLNDDKIKLWKVNLNSNSPEFKNIKMNKTQSHQEQCDEGRRPHISWDSLYPQIKEHCQLIYDNNFSNIFQKMSD
jgi:hypothetical protein